MSISPDAIIAFLAGVGSILGAGYSLRRARREERQRCDERVAELRVSYDSGIEKGLHMSERNV